MRMLRSLTVLSFLVMSASAVGCAEMPDSRSYRRNVPLAEQGEPQIPARKTSLVKLTGHLSSEGEGSVEKGLGGRDLVAVGKTVEIFKLGDKGQLTSITKADIQPGGAFELDLPDGGGAAEIFILKVKDIGEAVVGSAVINGLPAFVKAFAIDATVDTATSLKAEIVTTLAKGGVPGVQNYLNVINAYVDAQLVNSIVTVGAITTDLTTLIGAVGEAVIAAEGVIVEVLEKAGLPIDGAALLQAQATALSGIQGFVTDASGQLVTGSKDLVAALKAATAKAAAPIDQAIFNAVVSGGAAFSSKFKKGSGSVPVNADVANGDVQFAASQSVFKLETELSTDSIQDLFKQNGIGDGILDVVLKACGDFNARVGGAKNLGDLDAAKGQFRDALLGKSDAPNGGVLQLIAKALGDLVAILKNVEATFRPLVQNLATALGQPFDAANVSDALAKLDAGAQDLPAELQKVANPAEAKAISDALRMVEKAIAR